MKKVLAFYGAFNPPTNAHIALAKLAMDQGGYEGVVFVPSKGDYIVDEQKKEYAFTNDFRLEMLSDLALTRPWMSVSRHDMDQEEQPRTYESLCALKEEGYEPSLLIGTDVLERMETEWLNADKIAEEFGIVCLKRGSFTEDIIQESNFLSAIRQYITLIQTPAEYEMTSSTGARCQYDQALRYWKGLCRIVPPEVSALLMKDFADVLLSGGTHEA